MIFRVGYVHVAGAIYRFPVRVIKPAPVPVPSVKPAVPVPPGSYLTVGADLANAVVIGVGYVDVTGSIYATRRVVEIERPGTAICIPGGAVAATCILG
jgi:hypothetical protein